MSDSESKKLQKKFYKGVKDAQKGMTLGEILEDSLPTFLPPSKEHLAYRAGRDAYRRGEVTAPPNKSNREHVSNSRGVSGNDDASSPSFSLSQVIWIITSTIGELWALYMLGAPDKFIFSWFPFIIAVICAPGAFIGSLIMLMIVSIIGIALAIIGMVVMLIVGLVYFLVKSIAG